MHRGEPSRTEHETRSCESLSLRPKEEIGGACSQSEAWSEAMARRRALSLCEGASESRVLYLRVQSGISQAACEFEVLGVGSSPDSSTHRESATWSSV